MQEPPAPRYRDIQLHVRLPACPHCGYSFRGLGSEGSCPECGFAYDGDTFMLTGIARGMSTMSLGRKLLWIFVALGAWAGSLIMLVALSFGAHGLAVSSVLGALWLGVLIYLLATGQRGKRGAETYLFTSSGFGVANQKSKTEDPARRFRAWSDVNAVRVDRLGRNWHRLRIGRSKTGGRTFSSLVLDVNVQCDQATAADVRDFGESCIRRSPAPAIA